MRPGPSPKLFFCVCLTLQVLGLVFTDNSTGLLQISQGNPYSLLLPDGGNWYWNGKKRIQMAHWCNYLKYLGQVPILIFFFFVFAVTCLQNWSACFCCTYTWFCQLVFGLLKLGMQALCQGSVCHTMLANGIP